MSARALGYVTPNSQPWHDRRKGRIGGSEIAAILGLSKWESPFSLWHRKAGNLTDLPSSDVMTVGTYVEAATLHWWKDQHPGWVVNERAGTYVHRDREWQLANPDALAAEDVHENWSSVVECKFAIYDDEWGDEGTDEIPPYYLTQCRWYLDVLGFDTCHLAVLFGASGRFAQYVVHQDADDIALMRDAAQKFLESIKDGTPPAIDSHTATYQAVRELHPDIDGEEIEIDAETAGEWLDSKQMLDAAKAENREATSRLLDVMGSARLATWQDGTPFARRQPARNGAVALYQIKPKKEAKAS